MRQAAIFASLLVAIAYSAPQNEGWTHEWARSNLISSSTPPLPPRPMDTLSSSSAAASAPTPQLLGNPNAKLNLPPNAKLSADLLTASSASARMQVLKDAEGNNTADFKFDLNPSANPGAPGLGGKLSLANRATFPALTGLGTAFAGLFFAPCGLNTPHIHPRATEVFTLVTEGTITAGFVYENTFSMEISENLTQFQGMAFPQGSIHWQLNNECTPQVGIAGFSDEDPGASSVAQNFFQNTRDDIVQASLGFPAQITAENFKQLEQNIPRAFALGIKDCYARCGIAQ
ncbi:hypothetical protein LTS08_000693 [Lithohypha guttulata]|nr:hypothetical protein LTS08_000693 [Lithohypha guttulata]